MTTGGYSVSLNIDGPRDPQYVLELAEAFSGCVRVLNHLTRDHGALQYPSEADRLVREVALAVSRLPQLLGQAGAWLEAERAAGRILVPSGTFAGDPDLAVVTARLRLDEAAAYLAEAERALSAAAAVTAGLAAAETGEEHDSSEENGIE